MKDGGEFMPINNEAPCVSRGFLSAWKLELLCEFKGSFACLYDSKLRTPFRLHTIETAQA